MKIAAPILAEGRRSPATRRAGGGAASIPAIDAGGVVVTVLLLLLGALPFPVCALASSSPREEEANRRGCSRPCVDGGTCSRGRASFNPVLSRSVDSSGSGEAEAVPHKFLWRKNDENSEYCRDCPAGRTGFACGVEYEWCFRSVVGGNNDGGAGFACFHGGECVREERDGDGDGDIDGDGADGAGSPTGGYRCDCENGSAAAGTDYYADGGGGGGLGGLGHGLGSGSLPVAGRQCEHVATEVCEAEEAEAVGGGGEGEGGGANPSSDKDEETRRRRIVGFCTNGGRCVEGQARQDDMCRCPGGWTGPHCEYEVKSAEALNGDAAADSDADSAVTAASSSPPPDSGDQKDQVGAAAAAERDRDQDQDQEEDIDILPEKEEECSLKCYNGGECRKGEADFGPVLDTSRFGEPVPFLLERSRRGEHCHCPEGRTALLCDYKYKVCWERRGAGDVTAGAGDSSVWGEGLACFHGSECVNDSGDYEDLSAWRCDCERGFLDVPGFDPVMFAGRHCQYESSDVCYNDEEGKGRGRIGFCVNGGRCREGVTNKQNDNCRCPDGWTGPHCEISDVCSLQCQNGGRCVKGVVKDYDDSLEKFDLPFLSRDRDGEYEHCRCPERYTGPDCSIRLSYCDGDHVCLHGSKCDLKGESESGEKVFGCDCDLVLNGEGNLVAGEHCQYAATEYCSGSKESATTTRSFCANGGKCMVDNGAASQRHPGCWCQTGWTGDHCEYRKESLAINENAQRHDGDDKHLALISSILGVGAVATISVAGAVFMLKKQRSERSGVVHRRVLSPAGASPCKRKPTCVVGDTFHDMISPSSMREMPVDGSSVRNDSEGVGIIT